MEWSGRFKPAEEIRGEVIDAGQVIDAIGKLRGAALLLVVGGILMLGSAWIAQAPLSELQRHLRAI